MPRKRVSNQHGPARTQRDWDSILEDAEFMLSMGEHPERAARRAGVSLDTMQKRLGERRKALAESNTDPHQVEGTCRAS